MIIVIWSHICSNWPGLTVNHTTLKPMESSTLTIQHCILMCEFPLTATNTLCGFPIKKAILACNYTGDHGYLIGRLVGKWYTLTCC